MEKLQDNYPYFEEINPGVIRCIGSGLKILDIGCGYGCLGEAMVKKNNIVYGIDISSTAIERAKKRLHFACVADINKLDTLPGEIKRKSFDVVILADVLEHVYDPMGLLKKTKSFLKDDGRIILSIPNVASWAIRLQLLFGYWNYTTSGVLDRTHIRFFTLTSALRLLRAANFEIIRISATPYFLRAFAESLRNVFFKDYNNRVLSDPTALMKSSYYKFYLKYLYPVETFIASFWKRLFAFQFIIEANIIKTRIDTLIC